MEQSVNNSHFRFGFLTVESRLLKIYLVFKLPFLQITELMTRSMKIFPNTYREVIPSNIDKSSLTLLLSSSLLENKYSANFRTILHYSMFFNPHSQDHKFTRGLKASKTRSQTAPQTQRPSNVLVRLHPLHYLRPHGQ